jgi:dihydrofolate reductase
MTPHRTPRPLPALATIAAVARNGTIGDANRLPWRLPEDLKRFRALTSGHAVIMGRRTWESIGRALPERQNIVVTRQSGYTAAGAQVASSLDAALALVTLPEPAFCIGGGELYRIALPRSAALYLTEIHQPIPGDARFPAIDRTGWREESRVPGATPSADGLTYDFVAYTRRR